MRKRVLVVAPNPSGAVNFYRGYGPLMDIEEVEAAILVPNGQVVEWYDLEVFDILLFLRPETKYQLDIMQQAKRMGKKVWCDWDDLLWDMPNTHPLSAKYKDKEVRGNIARCMTYADINTFSTEYLMQRAVDNLGLQTGMIIVPNYARMKPQPVVATMSDRILWRGSNTHEPDLWAFKDVILEYCLSNDKAIDFHGYDPFYITGLLPNYRIYPFTDIYKSLDHIRSGGYKIGIVPLCDNPFNRAKSNIAALEMLSMGILPIVPDWEEWKGVGLTYTSSSDMRSAIEKAESMNKDIVELINIKRKVQSDRKLTAKSARSTIIRAI